VLKYSWVCNRRKAECRFEFDKRRQLVIRTRNETFFHHRDAFAIQIICPLESIAETQPQLQPASS
jgi:hypothetical protein